MQTMIIAGLSVKSKVFDINLNVKEKLNIIKRIDISEESTEGGVISCFIDGNYLSKIYVEQCWESGKYFLKILLRQNRIIRVDEIIKHYNVPFYVTKSLAKEIGSTEFFNEQKSKVIINSYYFKEDKITNFSTSSKQNIDKKEIQKSENAFKKRVQFVLNKIDDIKIIV
ncbi:hypothetical protein ACFL6I_10375 [candidate division KSB1 bacterium]